MQLVEDVHLIKCPWLHYGTSVCAILGEEIALIDSGTTVGPEEAILPYLTSVGRKPEEISHVILTHGRTIAVVHSAQKALLFKDGDS